MFLVVRKSDGRIFGYALSYFAAAAAAASPQGESELTAVDARHGALRPRRLTRRAVVNHVGATQQARPRVGRASAVQRARPARNVEPSRRYNFVTSVVEDVRFSDNPVGVISLIRAKINRASEFERNMQASSRTDDPSTWIGSGHVDAERVREFVSALSKAGTVSDVMRVEVSSGRAVQ